MGPVHAVLQVPAGVRLLARFPDEDESRDIALEATGNGEYLLPGDVRARYRPPTDDDREFLKVLAERSHRRLLIVPGQTPEQRLRLRQQVQKQLYGVNR